MTNQHVCGCSFYEIRTKGQSVRQGQSANENLIIFLPNPHSHVPLFISPGLVMPCFALARHFGERSSFQSLLNLSLDLFGWQLIFYNVHSPTSACRPVYELKPFRNKTITKTNRSFTPNQPRKSPSTIFNVPGMPSLLNSNWSRLRVPRSGHARLSCISGTRTTDRYHKRPSSTSIRPSQNRTTLSQTS